METEAQLIVQRASLRWLAQQHPTWTHQDLAVCAGQISGLGQEMAQARSRGQAHGCDGLTCSLSRSQDPTSLHHFADSGGATHSGDSCSASII